MDLPELSAVDFTLVRRRGYSQQEVDRFLEVLDAELRRAEAEIRLLERRVEEMEGAPVTDAPGSGADAEPPLAVAEAMERLVARSRATAAGILERAYRHAGMVDPGALPADLDRQVREEVEALLTDPERAPDRRAVEPASEEPVESAHRQARRFLKNAQLEAEQIVGAARAEHQGLVARIARLQDLESQLDGSGSTGPVPLRGRGVVVDLTGDEPVVTVTESGPIGEPAPSPERTEPDRPSRYAARSAGLPSMGDEEASAALSDLGGLRPDQEDD